MLRDRVGVAIARRRIVGALILVLVPVAAAIGTFRPAPWRDHHTIVAVFDEAKGVARVERDVRVRGVNVGKIGEVRRVGDDAEIKLVLDDDAGPIYADARATLRPHTAFEGSAFVDLDPGHPSAGPLGDRVIPRSRTRVYVALDQALRGLDTQRRRDLRGIAAQLRAATPVDVQDAVNRQLGELPRTLDDAALAARPVRGPGSRRLRAALRNISALSATLATEREPISASIADGRRTLAALRQDGALDGTLARLPIALAAVERGAATAVALTREVRRAADTVQPTLEEAPGLLARAVPMAKKAGPVLQSTPQLVAGLRRLLDNLGAAAPDLDALLVPTEETVQELDRRALPAITAKTRMGQQAYEQFLAAGTGLTGALANYQTLEQNPMGSGHVGNIGADVVDGLLGMAADRCQLTKLPQIPTLPGCP